MRRPLQYAVDAWRRPYDRTKVVRKIGDSCLLPFQGEVFEMQDVKGGHLARAGISSVSISPLACKTLAMFNERDFCRWFAETQPR